MVDCQNWSVYWHGELRESVSTYYDALRIALTIHIFEGGVVRIKDSRGNAVLRLPRDLRS